MPRLIISVVLLVASAACDGDPGAPDADADAGGDAAVDAAPPDDGVADPLPPSPPVLTPCPEGTVERLREGAPTECWPIAEPACVGEEVRYLGETTCGSVGSACPSGDFPDDVPAGAVFVLAGATGGDGSLGSPFGTVAAGIAAVGLGQTVVIGRGTYDEVLSIGRSVTLRGVCAAETILTSSSASTADGILNVTGGTVTLRDLSFRDALRGGVVVTGSGTMAHLEGLLIDATSSFGVYVDGSARATIDGLVFRDVATDTAGGLYGSGLVVDTSGEVTASRVVVERAHSAGINVLGGAKLTVDRLVIRDIEANNRGDGGRGLSIKGGSVVDVDRLWIERTLEIAVEVRDVDTVATVRRAVIADTRLDPSGLSSRPFSIFGDSRVTLRQVVVERFGDTGVFVSTGATVDAEDVVVREARGHGDGDFGRFVEVQRGASFTGRRLRFEDGKDAGLAVTDEGTQVVIEDLHLEGLTGRISDGAFGRGINVQFGGSLELRRAAIIDTRNVAVLVDSSSFIAEDVDVRGVTPVDGTRRGRGFSIQFGASANLVRVRADDTFDLGLFAGGDGTDVVAEDLTVRRITAPLCPTGESCSVDPGGIGVGVYEGARCNVTRIDVSEASLCGVHVAARGELDLAGGHIRDSAIGACVQIDGYDISRLDSVRFEGNVIPLEATSLPVPPASMTISM